MEKRKVFKISIIDKEISRTEFDRNTFYTSDSELTLVFKLIEKDYKYDHGEILLYNENDKSFVTRPITKQENDFVYELDLDIIPHYGTWKAQLQLINDGDVYTSKPFEFVIENDLSNLAPQPTLTDINNWATLKQSANELIDEMRDVIVDIKKAESQHENAERLRKNQENSRVQSESERQSQERLRSQGESQRQRKENKRIESENERRLEEIERNKNESNRQTIFENNEVRRKETFNNNEETRQENEATRQQAEGERQSAELIRVNNENQRKTDHANRSAEFEGKADKVIIKNLIENGDFSEGFDGWIKVTPKDTYTIDEGIISINNAAGGSGIAQYTSDYRLGKYYISARYSGLKINVRFRVGLGGAIRVLEYLPDSENITPYSVISELAHDDVDTLMLVSQDISSPYKVDNLSIINLTQTFGAGNEPTKEEMDELIKITGYIDGEYALNNKEMLIWTLALIRRKKNAIITLGGTI